jgi:hypothetical protein
MTSEFEEAVQKVTRDIYLDEGKGADLVAVGIQREDCLEFLEESLGNEPINAELLAVLVQMSVAIGVWIERARWESV